MKWTRYLFLIFLGLSLIAFFPTIGSGFVYDFPGWQKEYAQGSFINILDCFGYNGNHQFLHFVFYTFYRIFHIQGFPWYIFFCILHAINGYLLYHLIITLCRQWLINIPSAVAFASAAIFLLHPYSVEAVVWKVCVHYLISLMAVLIILISFVKFTSDNNRKA